jgi:hypothetical protein
MGPTWSRPLVFSFCPLVQLRNVKPSSLPHTDYSQPYSLTSKFQLYIHCSENSKPILPEMKLCGLVPNFYIHVSGSDLYIPTIGLISNFYFLCCVGELSAPAVELNVHINSQHTNFQFGKLRIINRNN